MPGDTERIIESWSDGTVAAAEAPRAGDPGHQRDQVRHHSATSPRPGQGRQRQCSRRAPACRCWRSTPTMGAVLGLPSGRLWTRTGDVTDTPWPARPGGPRVGALAQHRRAGRGGAGAGAHDHRHSTTARATSMPIGRARRTTRLHLLSRVHARPCAGVGQNPAPGGHAHPVTAPRRCSPCPSAWIAPRARRICACASAPRCSSWPGRRPAPAHLPASVELRFVEVVELHPPKGAEPVHWLLLTTHALASVADSLARSSPGDKQRLDHRSSSSDSQDAGPAHRGQPARTPPIASLKLRRDRGEGRRHRHPALQAGWPRPSAGSSLRCERGRSARRLQPQPRCSKHNGSRTQHRRSLRLSLDHRPASALDGYPSSKSPDPHHEARRSSRRDELVHAVTLHWSRRCRCAGPQVRFCRDDGNLDVR